MAENSSLVCGEAEWTDDGSHLVHGFELESDSVGWMIEREKEHLPRNDYVMRFGDGELDERMRRNALEWMFKVCCRYKFGEVCLYLAMRTFDRFISVMESPELSKKWLFQLTALASLSLAAKLEEVSIPNSIVHLQVGRLKFMFAAKTIQRMETMIMSTLKWRIKALTPFDFIGYYLRNAKGSSEVLSAATIRRSLKIVSSTVEGLKFLEFRPSELAAATALYVTMETQELESDKFISATTGLVDMVRIKKCTELIQEMVSNKGLREMISDHYGYSDEDVEAIDLRSPKTVLESRSLMYESDENGSLDSWPSSGSSSSSSSQEYKRRRLE